MIRSPHFLEEVVDFITSAPSPEAVLSFRPSNEAQTYLNTLLDRKANQQLSEEEGEELTYYLFLEHLMRMSKLKAAEKRV